MSIRVLASSLNALPFIAAATAVFLAIPAFAQAPAAAVKTSAEASAIPRAADGHPDLSGVYSNATSVPVVRPAACGDKEFYTPEEAAAHVRGCGPAGARAGRGGGRGGRGGGTPGPTVHYNVSQFGLDGSHAVRAASLRTSIITGPEGHLPPLTPEAQKRAADIRAYDAVHQWDSAKDRPLTERCIMWPAEGPPMMPEGYNSDVQIVQGNGYVAVLQEMIHDVRVIPIVARPHLASNVHQWFGDARGHWEGDTLVVETTNFTNKTFLQDAPTTDQLKVTERFSRVDANTVSYQFTVNDPGTWTKPWSGEVNMAKIDTPIYEYACHEGNYGIANTLSGVRATEAKAAEQK